MLTQKQQPKIWQMLLAWLTIFSIFIIPIFLSYNISTILQTAYMSISETLGVDQLVHNYFLVHHFLFGSFGIFTLGVFSIIWALPLVILLQVVTILLTKSGLKKRLIWAIEPNMLQVGLNGADFLPILEGFGCNTTAVLSAAKCNSCSKVSCISMISFGSACSYQLGAAIAIFSIAGMLPLVFPYLILLLIASAAHTRFWYKKKPHLNSTYYTNNQVEPVDRQTVKAAFADTFSMFFTQAFPIFMAICFVASILVLTPLFGFIEKLIAPVLTLLQLPVEASFGVVFSIIRKDGMLLFNQDNGIILQNLHPLSLLVLVFFTSTFSSCLVTMSAIFKQIGAKKCAFLVGTQMLTSTVFSFIFSLPLIFNLI